MPTDLLHIPLAPGLNDGADASVLPVGALRAVRNLRPRRAGRFAKRCGVTAVDLSTASGAISGTPSALAEWQGRPVLIEDGSAWEREGAKWAQHGTLMAQFQPVGSDVIARASTPGALATSTTHTPSIAYVASTGAVVYAWHIAGASVNPAYAVYDEDGGCLASGAIPLSGGVGRYVHIANSSGDTVIFVMEKAGGVLQGIAFDTGTLTFGSEAAVGTLNAAGNFWDIANYSNTQWLLAYQIGATQIRVALMTGTTQTTSYTTATPGGIAEGIGVMGAVGENIYLAWTGGAVSGNVYFAVYPTSLASETATATVDGSSVAIGQPTLVRASSSSAKVYFTKYDESAFNASVWDYTLTNVGGATLGTSVDHFRLASKAFVNNGRFLVWVHTDEWTTSGSSPSDGWFLQRTCYLLEPGTPYIHLHASPLRGTQRDPSFLAPVVRVSGAVDPYHAWPMVEVILQDTPTIAGLAHVRALKFESMVESQRAAVRPWVSDGQGLVFAGGVIAEYTGELYENNFWYRPVIEDASTSAGGSVNDGDHYYYAVFEWVDRAGRRHRSGPSDPVLATPGGGSNTVTLKITTFDPGRNAFGGAQYSLHLAYIHVYRTRVGIAVAQRISTILNSPAARDAYGSAVIATYVDTIADASIVDNEYLYTEGEVQPNIIPPASRFIAAGGNRIWLGGGFAPSTVTASKVLVSVEPPQFTNNDAFRIDFPEPVTGLAWGDGALIAWTATGIYLVSGSGPNDEAQGSFSEPQRIPSAVGCSDYRSVLEVPAGWLFLSPRGFYLLPRGFGSPVPVPDADETIAANPFILSAAVIRKASGVDNKTGEIEARYVIAASRTASVGAFELVFDARINRFVSVDDPTGCLVGQFGTTAGHLTSASVLYEETFGSFGSAAGAFVQSTWRTGDIRPFGLLGQGGCHKIHLYGEWMGAATISCTATIDGVAQGAVTLTPKTLKGGATPSTRGERWYAEFHPAQDKFNSIDISVTDTNATASEGLVWLGAALEGEFSPGTRRLSSGARA